MLCTGILFSRAESNISTSAAESSPASSGKALGHSEIEGSELAAPRVEFAPMPSATVSTATAVKSGFLTSSRKANRTSFNIQSYQLRSRRRLLEDDSPFDPSFGLIDNAPVEEIPSKWDGRGGLRTSFGGTISHMAFKRAVHRSCQRYRLENREILKGFLDDRPVVGFSHPTTGTISRFLKYSVTF